MKGENYMIPKEISELIRISIQRDCDYLMKSMMLPIRPTIRLDMNCDLYQLSEEDVEQLPLIEQNQVTGAYRICLHGDDADELVFQLSQAVWWLYCKLNYCTFIPEQSELFENYYRYYLRKEPLPNGEVFLLGNIELPVIEVCKMISCLPLGSNSEIKTTKNWRVM